MFGKSYLIESKNKQSDFKLEIEQIRGPFESFKGYWSLIEKEKKQKFPLTQFLHYLSSLMQ